MDGWLVRHWIEWFGRDIAIDRIWATGIAWDHDEPACPKA
jgi:hypothetical protein